MIAVVSLVVVLLRLGVVVVLLVVVLLGVLLVVVLLGVLLVVVLLGDLLRVVLLGVLLGVVLLGVVVVVVGVVVVVVVGGARNQHESRESSSSRKQETRAGPVHQHNQGDCPQQNLAFISQELQVLVIGQLESVTEEGVNTWSQQGNSGI